MTLVRMLDSLWAIVFLSSVVTMGTIKTIIQEGISTHLLQVVFLPGF